MVSQTKAAILQAHQENSFLNAPSPAPMLRNEQDFSADEMFAPLDERIITTVTEALESGQTHYVDVPGIPPLRAAVAEFLNETSGTQYAPGNIIVSAGIQESRFLTIQMIGEQFDRIAIPAVVHPGVRRALGVRPRNVETLAVDERMLPTTASIRAALEVGTRLLYLESPSRLTGATYSAEEVNDLATLLNQFEASVIWDQGLAPWSSGATSLASHQNLSEQIAVIGEAWPGAGLASWFLAYIAAPQTWVPSIQSQKQIMAICTSTASQYAALEASKIYAEGHAHNRNRLSQMRQALVTHSQTAGLEVIPGDVMNILALRLSPEQKNATLRQLNQAGYPVTDGTDFGAADLIRISLSPNLNSETLMTALSTTA